MSAEVARRECEILARKLPQGLKLTSLQDLTYCGRTHRVARFSRREKGDLVHFVLVPGGDVRLGFAGDDFKPAPWQIESFRGWPEELVKRGADPRYVKHSIEEYVDWSTTSPRNVHVPTVLMEQESKQVAPREDLIRIDENDPIYKEYSSTWRDNGRHELMHNEFYDGIFGEVCHIIERTDSDTFSLWRRPATTVRYIEEQLSKDGMRLASSDEWEHACGAGATTLFRWGDDTPFDFFPIDTCAEDRELKKAWAFSLGKLNYETPPPGWDLHDQPNLFGLRIANDPYRSDIIADEPWARGGDGGQYICGSGSVFLGWLPLATAFRDLYRDTRFAPDKNNVANDYHRLRRVIPLD